MSPANTTATPHRQRNPFGLGWEAVKANLVPGLILQALMLLLLAAYYLVPPVAELLNRLADYKRAHGLAFVVIATVVAASIVPEIFLVLVFQRGRAHWENLRNLLFTAPIWAIDGIAVDYLYRGLAALLGDTTDPVVVIAKICIDQFVYNVFFAAPYGVVAYQWKNSGYDFNVLRRSLTLDYYRQKIVPTLCATWAVWMPLMAIIYSLPFALQFPVFSLAITFWVLLLTYMTNRFAGKVAQSAAVLPVEIAPKIAP